MKIGVIEWDVSILGGRQKSMLAFAEYLALRHEVQFWGGFHHPQPRYDYTKQTWKRWHALDPFTGVDFNLDGIERPKTYLEKGIPAEWKTFDMLLCPYGNFGMLAPELPNTKVVCWNIHPDMGYYPGVAETWTNSKSVKALLLKTGKYEGEEHRLHVVIPPHTYLPFTKKARPFHKREFDCCTVGQLIETKGLMEFQQFISDNHLRGVILAAGNIRPDENARVGEALKNMGADVRLYSTASEVASVMGNSKAFLTFTHVESCSLALYEAMNAGCVPVIRDTSWAAAEQMGAAGTIFSHETWEAANAVRAAEQRDSSVAMNQGSQFDRTATSYNLNRRMKVLCEA